MIPNLGSQESHRDLRVVCNEKAGESEEPCVSADDGDGVLSEALLANC